MKMKIVEVGDVGVHILPLSCTFMLVMGWKDGDELQLDVVETSVGKPDHVIMYKRESK